MIIAISIQSKNHKILFIVFSLQCKNFNHYNFVKLFLFDFKSILLYYTLVKGVYFIV